MKKEYFKPTQRVVELKNRMVLLGNSFSTFRSVRTNLSDGDALGFDGGGNYEAR